MLHNICTNDLSSHDILPKTKRISKGPLPRPLLVSEIVIGCYDWPWRKGAKATPSIYFVRNLLIRGQRFLLITNDRSTEMLSRLKNHITTNEIIIISANSTSFWPVQGDSECVIIPLISVSTNWSPKRHNRLSRVYFEVYHVTGYLVCCAVYFGST